MTRAEHVRALLAEYAEQRSLDEREQRARLDAAVARAPEIGRLRQESADLAFGAMRSILGETDPARRQALAQDMKVRGRAINARIRQLLAGAGMPADALETRYRCPICRDTGYTDEGMVCSCCRQRAEEAFRWHTGTEKA